MPQCMPLAARDGLATAHCEREQCSVSQQKTSSGLHSAAGHQTPQIRSSAEYATEYHRMYMHGTRHWPPLEDSAGPHLADRAT
jgi:hypothetical protein